MSLGESTVPNDGDSLTLVSLNKDALHAIFKESDLGILVFDKYGELCYSNPRAQQLFQTVRMKDLRRILTKPTASCSTYHSYIIVDTSVDCSLVFKIKDVQLPNKAVLRAIHPVNMPAFENEVCSTKQQTASAILILDRQGNIISCNEGAAEILQLPLNQILGKNFIELTSPVPGFPLLSLEKACERSLQCCIRFRGQDNWVNISVKPCYDDSDVAQYIVAIYDITDIKRQQREKAHQEKLATLGRIAARLAHEIKNPLTGIKGFLQLIQLYLDRGDKQKLQEYLATALDETEHLSDLVTDFLNFALPHEPCTEAIRLAELLEETAVLISSVCYLNGIEYKIEISDHDLAILGDKRQIKQIITNIAHNAIDALKTAQERQLYLTAAKNDPMCEIAIANTGPQIPQKVLNSIFDPFFTTKDSGTGLGLSTCARLARENGGHIEVSTTPQLTTFRVFLPLAKGSASDVQPPASISHLPNGAH